MDEKNNVENLPELTLEVLGADDGDNESGKPPYADQRKPGALSEIESAAPLEEDRLSPAERQLVEEFSKKIDLTNSTQVLKYGSVAQEKVASFADSALGQVRTKDLGEVGSMIIELVNELKGFSAEEEKKGFNIFRRASNKLTAAKNRYDKAEVSVDKLVGALESHQTVLLKDIAVLDKLYQINLTNFKELSLYILAGKRRLENARSTTLSELVDRARISGLPEDAQAANDFSALCDRFEKRVHDLELTRMIAIQSAPQIRLVQNNNSVLTEKIQTIMVNTIPLWKSQMLISLGLTHSKDALEAQRKITDMTNELLKRNADALKLSTVETARESERGVVDIETLTYTNNSLISTLDEVVKINEEGRAKRRSAEAELRRIENELKDKLLELKN